MVDRALTPREAAAAAPPPPPRQQAPWETAPAVPLPEGVFQPQEYWAWAKIIRGEPADMRFAIYDRDDGMGEDPKDVAKWPKTRTLSAAFLRTILFHEPWKSALAKPQVNIGYAIFKEEIDWENQQFEGEIGLFHCRFEADLMIFGLSLGRNLFLQGSVLEGQLLGDRMQTSGALYCRAGFFAKSGVRLRGVRIGGNTEFDGADVGAGLDLDGSHLGGSLYCRDGFSVEGDLQLPGVEIGGALQVRGAKLGGHVNLTGARIAGALELAQTDDFPAWGPDARLILRNAAAGAFAGPIDALRCAEGGKKGYVRSDLSGFTYERLGGFKSQPGQTIADAPVREIVRMLEARIDDGGAFDPQPYRQMAQALAAAGFEAKARHVRIALKNHEMFARNTPVWERVGLFFSGLFTGFGQRMELALAWFLAAVAAGAGYGIWAVRPAADPGQIADWARFSFGNAIPLITIDKSHETFLADQLAAGAPRFFDHWIQLAFDGQKLFGYILLTFVAAALAGMGKDKA